MSDFGVYDDEMLNNRFSDQDVERLLSGGMPEDEDLAGLTPILETLHGGERRPLPEERIARFAAQAAEIATSTRPELAGTAVPERTATRSRRFVWALRQKMATGLAAALLLSGMTGVAAASNGAAPGDILYGLDRALEEVGFLDGGAAERIAEAQSLFNEGQVADAVAHAAEAVQVEIDGDVEANVEVMTSQEASDALISAADRLRLLSNDDDASIEVIGDDVLVNVADLLRYIAEPGEDTGSDFGQEVASRARQISGESNEAADTGADNADNADNAAEESEDAPPEDVPAGPPDSVPPSNTTGRP